MIVFKNKELKSLVFSLMIILLGALLPFAFAPYGIYPLAVLCLGLLLLLWLNISAEQAFWRGLLFGAGYFGVGISWVFISIHQYGNTDAWLAGLITFLFVFILALFPALTGFLLNRFFLQNNFSKLCLAFPSLWVLLEWIRSWIFTGFPWLLLGASQTNSPLRGFIPVVGEYGLSFVVTLSAGLLIFLLIQIKQAATGKTSRQIIIFTKIATVSFVILSLWLIGAALTTKQWTYPVGSPIKVSLVQGNIPQQLKWDRAYLETTLKRYYDLTQQHWSSHIIVWPEAAIPLLKKDAQGFLDILNQEAKQNHASLITGIPIQDGFKYYNAIIALGTEYATYYKRHLVPFGEYVPFPELLRGLIGLFNIPMSDFSAGSMQQPNFIVNGIKIAPFICYEIIYPEIVLNEMPKAEILLTLSNDAWFGRSFASAQHLQISQLMAQATGRYLIFSSNDGITAIVTPKGEIQQKLPRFEVNVLTGNVRAMRGTTPWIKLGDNPIICLLFILLVVAAIINKKSSSV